jgi:pimeloyl-ACP methyl ester carboxylesterase
MGGAAAIDFSLTYPQAVKKLVLIDSAGLRAGSAMSRFLFEPLGYMATEFLRNPKVRERVSRTAYHDQKWVSVDAQLCAALHLEMPSWHQALIAFTKSGGYSSFAERLAQIHQPTLILWGENDRILGIGDADKFNRAIAHSKLIWVKNCGHVPHLEQPSITAQHILDFTHSIS